MTTFRRAIQVLIVPAATLLFSRSSALVSRTTASSARFMSTTNAADDRIIRILTLHGSGGNQREFLSSIAPIELSLTEKNIRVELISMDAPIPNGNGFSWWTYGPEERSSTAKKYCGFDESAAMVLGAFERAKVDVVLAHSQGAILVTALLALNLIPSHSNARYLLNGVAWPNPYSNELGSLKLDSAPRVMFVMGERDTINPVDGQERVRKCMELAGCNITVCSHSGGHSLPTNDKAAIEAIIEWIKD